MKTYTFHCGGDCGAWECDVDVLLSSKEEELLKGFVQNNRNEFLDWFPPMDKIYSKVLAELENECEDLDADSVVIWLPYGMRDAK